MKGKRTLNQITYNLENLFIGPSPASGDHFINYTGGLNNQYLDINQSNINFNPKTPNPRTVSNNITIDSNLNTFPRNHNLLKRLDRIQNINYEIVSSRTIINQIGKASSVDNIHLNKPQVNLNFSYIVANLKNEARMGFNINHPRLDFPYTGDVYSDRNDFGLPSFLFSGFLNRDYIKNNPIDVNRGEGVDIDSSCFGTINPVTPNQNFISNIIPFWQSLEKGKFKKIRMGLYHSFLFSDERIISGIGDNSQGQLTNTINENNSEGNFTGIFSKTLVGKLTNIIEISTNYAHTLALLSGGAVTGWGANYEGQAVGTADYNDNNNLFTGNWTNTPVSNLSGIIDISAGAYHSLALKDDGTITGWGDDIYGQASSGNNLNNITKISAGGYHSLAIININGGMVTGWGNNDYGQSSNGNYLTGVKEISAGHLHSIAMLNNGKVTGWGLNEDSQVQGLNFVVRNLNEVKDIKAGWFGNLATLENGKITGWGLNHMGQLTNSTGENNPEGIFTGNWSNTLLSSLDTNSNSIINLQTNYQNSNILYSNGNNYYYLLSFGENYNQNFSGLQNAINVNVKYFCTTDDPYWPFNTRDKRNIFITISKNDLDAKENYYEDFISPDNQTYISRSAAPNFNNLNVIGFGNCYLNSYRQSASIGNFIISEVNYIGENMSYSTSGSGILTPYASPLDWPNIPINKYCNIPSEIDSKNPIAALLPGDLTIDIKSKKSLYTKDSYFLDLENLKILGYEFGFTLNRENMDAIGYKLPIDREVNFPLIIDLSIDMIIDNHLFDDSLSYLAYNDAKFDISIKCKNNCNYNKNFVPPSQSQSSIFEKKIEEALGYTFKDCRFESISYDNQIGNRKTANIKFSLEINPENYSEGMFASGFLNVEKIEDFILIESGLLPALAGANTIDGSYLLQEDNNLLVSNLTPLF